MDEVMESESALGPMTADEKAQFSKAFWQVMEEERARAEGFVNHPSNAILKTRQLRDIVMDLRNLDTCLYKLFIDEKQRDEQERV